uniref:Methyltransferase n=1 Tax=viral metagenome TaxID=1070528 RepID=A0A6C0DB61_9ZZZZ
MFERRKIFINRRQFIEDTKIENLHYAWSHGVNGSNTLPVIFELTKMIKPKVCVIIGTGDGLIPRIIREAQIKSLVNDSKTYLIDLGETMGAMPNQIHNKNSMFRIMYPEIIVYKDYSVPGGIDFISKLESEIDLLWIDGDHSYEGSLNDFVQYSKLVGKNGLIFLHDTAPNGAGETQPTWCGVDKTIEYIRNNKEFELINFTKTDKLDIGMGFAIVKRNLQNN